MKKKLVRKLKLIAVYSSMLYLVGGVIELKNKDDGQKEEVSIVYAQRAEVAKEEEPKIVTPKATEVAKEEEYISEEVKFSEEDKYLLAKIAMAEAEGEDIVGKAHVIRVVLNRVDSNSFPNTIEEVIYQKKQFSPIADGRFNAVEPNEDCWKALQMVLDGWDETNGALYFESGGKSAWHRNNLEYMFQHGKHYFYR